MPRSQERLVRQSLFLRPGRSGRVGHATGIELLTQKPFVEFAPKPAQLREFVLQETDLRATPLQLLPRRRKTGQQRISRQNPPLRPVIIDHIAQNSHVALPLGLTLAFQSRFIVGIPGPQTRIHLVIVHLVGRLALGILHPAERHILLMDGIVLRIGAQNGRVGLRGGAQPLAKPIDGRHRITQPRIVQPGQGEDLGGDPRLFGIVEVDLARALRKQVPQMASLIGFYNAGLTRAERMRVEELFRTDALCTLVSTSAFGEGVNIPNIRNVVLYHLPFNEIEFNQMSGRAGRDGQPARIHLLFGREDAAVNARALDAATPDHDRMAQVYREIRRMQRERGDGFFAVTDEELAAAASNHPAQPQLQPASAACGIAVFRELGLVETRTVTVAGVPTRSVRLLDAGSKVELTDSVRYREGLDEREIFNAFRDWALKVPCETLQARLCRPILPESEGGDRS